jgi:hypothetical protein
MTKCSPADISFPIPSAPLSSPIPGFGAPFSVKLPASPLGDLNGMPEDLQAVFDKLSLLLPPGAIKPSMNPNSSKDVFDAIMSMMDKFFPFLMMYKFFMPVLNLIVCIIEVICSLLNPFTLGSKISKLMNQCLPQFLSLFPIFAVIVMIISILLLIIALIEYFIEQIKALIELIISNIVALETAIERQDEEGLMRTAEKISSLLCYFQSFFVGLAILNIIIEVFRELLRLSFHIPPCADGQSGDTNSCCTPETCPDFIKSGAFTRNGTLQYLNGVEVVTSLPFFANSDGFYSVTAREASYQLFDDDSPESKQFINIVNAYDITAYPEEEKPTFFPTDVTYTSTTAVKQAAYTVDLRLFYNPAAFGRTGVARYIKFKDCIVLKVPSKTLSVYDNTTVEKDSGVIRLGGGTGTEDDGTPLSSVNQDGTEGVGKATLENFLYMPIVRTSSPSFNPSDGYTFEPINLEYTFKPNFYILFGKGLITGGCVPSISESRTFLQNVIGNDIAYRNSKLQELALVDNADGTTSGGSGNVRLPNPAATADCFTAAINEFVQNVSVSTATELQVKLLLCLEQLKSDTVGALDALVDIAFDRYQSKFTIDPDVQFTTKTIAVSVDLLESGGNTIANSLPADIGQRMADDLSAVATLGTISKFKYDGARYFNAEISSSKPGKGVVSVAYQNQVISVITPSDVNTIPPTVTAIELPYEFIYTASLNVESNEMNRRDETDVSQDLTGGRNE